MLTSPSSTRAVTVADIGEHAVVARILDRLPAAPWLTVGPGDDAAVLEQEPRLLEVLTTDALIEGVHFDRRFVPPDAIGHRALAVNLSDIAAMGGRPRAVLVSLALPATYPVEHLDRLLDGLLALAARERVIVVGGNITRSPGPLMVDVTATGGVKRRRILRRGGARPGDDVYVTGTLGDAAVGLAALRATDDTFAPEQPRAADWPVIGEARYLRPIPRTRAGWLLGTQKVATACIDLSDGLADGLRRLAHDSGVGIRVHADALPITDEVRHRHLDDPDAILRTVLTGGDDYELLFTCAPRSKGRLRGVLRLLDGLPITRVGEVIKGRDVCVRTSTGDQDVPDGFAHFA